MNKTYFVKTRQSDKHLGYFNGCLEEIALFLADKCQGNEALVFYPVQFQAIGLPTESSVQVELSNIEYDESRSNFDNVKYNIGVGDTLNGKYLNIRLRDETDVIRYKALSKLSEREKEVLGIK